MIRKISSKQMYKNQWMTVTEDQVEFANGHQGIYGVVHKADFALIIPFDGKYLHFVEQFRYPTGQKSIEFPQGAHEGSEDTNSLQLAKAELQEEIGLVAGKMRKLGYLKETPGSSNQGFDVFLAEDLSEGETNFDTTEADLVHLKFSIEEFEQMIVSGQISDAPTVSAYTLFKLRDK